MPGRVNSPESKLAAFWNDKQHDIISDGVPTDHTVRHPALRIRIMWIIDQGDSSAIIAIMNHRHPFLSGTGCATKLDRVEVKALEIYCSWGSWASRALLA